MTNETTTLDGALQELGETMATNISAKGVTASASDGLTTLAEKIAQISTGGGGGCTRLVTGNFTTGSTRGGTGSVSINYTGSGYPIACMVFISNGANNSTAQGNTDWVGSVTRYDVGFYSMSKAEINTTPTYVTSSSVTANQGVVTIIYKNSTSDSTSYTRTSNMAAVVYNSTDGASSYNCVRFKGNGKTLSWYVGNKASNRVGLVPSTKYDYIVVYSS